MLVLSRKAQEAIHIGPDIIVKVLRIEGSRVKLGIDAPTDIKVLREELLSGEKMLVNEVVSEPAERHGDVVLVQEAEGE